jgi:rubredoxin
VAKWKCGKCGYIFDEEKEKKKFEELPADWKCPKCGSPKSRFKKMPESPKKK